MNRPLLQLALIQLLLFPFLALSNPSFESDLTNYDFKNKPPVTLNQEWLFAYGEFIKTEQEDQSSFEVLASLSRWDKLGYPARGFGSYRLEVLVNSNESLVLKIPDVFSAYELFINGRLLTSVGKIGRKKEDYEPKRVVKYIDIPQSSVASGRLDILFHVSNFSHSKGGLGAAPSIGSRDIIYRNKFLNDSYDVFLTGALIMGSLFFLGLYFYGRKEYMTFYFALFCLVYAYRVIGWGNYVLHDLIDIPYHIAIRLEYATFYLAGFFFGKYLINLFPKETPKILAKTFIYASFIWTLSTVLPVYYFTQINSYYLYILLFGLIIVAISFIRASVNGQPGAKLAIYSTFGIFGIFIMKSLVYMGWVVEIKSISILGEICFFFFQALILSKYFIKAWKDAKLEADQIAQTKAEFLSVMSHEIRTPLNALIGTTYHMIDASPREDQKQDLFNLKNSSENLLNLVNNILDFNKIEQNKLELEQNTVSLETYIKNQINLFESLANEKGIFLKLYYDHSLPEYVKMDKGRVAQILSNLVGNAIKFTNSGGVTVKVKSEGITKAIGVNFVNIRFDIIDTGIGISEDQKERIFESFEQANRSIAGLYGGTGLGLAITKSLLKHMKSIIKVESTLDKGSVFSFNLRLDIAKEEQPIRVSKSDDDLKGCRLLLAEDNPMNIMIAKRFLQKWQIEVDVAENGQIAVNMALNPAKKYDLILMDLQMPILNGHEAAATIRKSGFKKPIIAVTASAITTSELKENEGEIQGFITKPYKPEDLYNTIKKHYNSPPIIDVII